MTGGGATRGGARCSHHPDRDAVAVCVRCGRTVCGSCSTRLDGINHCLDCLRAMAPAPRTVTAGPGGRAQRAATWALALGGLAGCYEMAALAGLAVAARAETPAERQRRDNLTRLAAVGGALRDFRLDTGRYPTGDEGLPALHDPQVLAAETAKLWLGPYLRPDGEDGAFLDAFGHPVDYARVEETYVLLSPGADGELDTPSEALSPGDEPFHDDQAEWGD
ncbi:MAG: type II secretion system protein GspG [Planctomycetes bacterium]|nr:type II secretion system protein GspG [Planctomycetota bacterium]